MIIIYLKTSEKIFQIKNTHNVTIATINNGLCKDGFIRIYNYIFPCNDIEHIEVTD